MPYPSQLIGIIEMETDPQVSVRVDATVGDLLRSLRRECGWLPEERFPEGVELDLCQVYDAVESIHLLHADLPHLKADLEHELRRLIQRLLAAM
ncbi:MAG: hypothetical protein ACYC6N_01120 [Pirellulaceae bacterium]